MIKEYRKVTYLNVYGALFTSMYPVRNVRNAAYVKKATRYSGMV